MRLPSALKDALPLLMCPLCGSALTARDLSLVCAAGHCHDVSAKGYVNFVLNRKPVKGYSAESFAHRGRVLALGYYDALLDELAALLMARGAGTLLDAGCGDGTWARQAARRVGAQVLAVDNAKESIAQAARLGGDVCWMVGDIARLPIRGGTLDAVMNVFAPANYAQFARVLKPGGLLVKLIPGEAHLKELRRAAGGALRAQQYSPRRVADYFSQHFTLLDSRVISRTLSIAGEALESLICMTPLLFDADKARIDRGGISEITIEAVMLTGESKAASAR